MRLFLTTCDHYRHIVPAHVALLEKYWPGQELVVLCFQPPDWDPPSHVEVISMGKEPPGKVWTDPLMDYFGSIDDPYFAHALDDYLPVVPIDTEKVAVLEREVREGRAAKAMLIHHYGAKAPPGYPGAVEEYTVPYIHSDEIPEKYRDIVRMSPRTSTELPTDNAGWGKLAPAPAIWSRDYFLRYMKRGQNVWDWSQRTTEMVDDGAVVIEFSDGHNIYTFLHVFTQGPSGRSGTVLVPEILGPENVDVAEEDLAMIRELTGVPITEVGFTNS